MVRRQGSRFGVTTNHSVRRSHIAAGNQEANQFVVVKTMSGASGTSKGNERVLTEYAQQIQDGNLAIDDGNKKESPILYSLNKHKRWELPEMLKENILDKDNHTESKFQVTLSERHIGGASQDISSRSGDCISVHQSKSNQTQRLPKNTYAFETDLTGPSRKSGRKKQRRNRQRQVETVSEEAVVNEEDLLPEIHYEVCYPRPRNKYHNYGKANKGHSDTVTVKSGKKSNKKDKIGWDDLLEAEFDHYEEYEEEDFPSRFDEDSYYTNVKENKLFTSESCRLNQSELESDYSSISLGDVLVTLLIDAVCAENEQDRPKRRHNSKSSVSSVEDLDNETKDHIVIIDKEEAEKFQPKEEDTEEPKPANKRARKRQRRGHHQNSEPEPQVVEATPVEVTELNFVKKISVNSLKPDSLHSTFGERYHEGHCIPRRFVINLKPTVEEYLMDKGHDRTAKTLMESGHQMMLLFEPFGCIEGVIGSNQPAFRQVRMKTFGFSHDFMREMDKLTKDLCTCISHAYPWRAIKMEPPAVESTPPHEHICGSAIWNVSQIVDFFHKKLSGVPQNSFYRADGAISWVAKRPIVTLDTVQTMTQIEWHSSTPSAIVQTVPSEVDVKQPTNSSSDAKPTNCTICYESLMTSAGGMDASALTACGHWFCNDCWTQHLRSRIKQGDIKITCPEFDCNTPVDKVLALTYLTPKEYRTQILYHRNTTLNTQPDWKWCPNTACGRLVKTVSKPGVTPVNGDTTVAINCECGFLWCSSCKGEGHWPATCEQAAAYWKLIKKNGSVRWKMFSVMGDILHVNVKKCPFCSNLIEKNTGCNYMMCVCHRAFCWDCLQDYEKHDWGQCRNNMKQLQKVTIKQVKPIVTSMPGVALQHRERRTRLAVMKRRKAAEILAKKAFLIRQGAKDQAVLHLPNIDDTSSIASSSLSTSSLSSCKSLPLTWMQDDEASMEQLQDLLETAAQVAKFCSEAEFCLEHLEVLCNDPYTKLKSPATLLLLKDRLIFITNQLHMIIHGELEVNADSAMGRVTILMHAGKKCLKWIATNVPLVLSHNDEE